MRSISSFTLSTTEPLSMPMDPSSETGLHDQRKLDIVRVIGGRPLYEVAEVRFFIL